ncbi:MAG: ABC transporter ATP-binding protein, partial [Lentisphaeria bacterium]|nr:ABC transporter ATP-binding protein [Lentisphaeria bacterium]
LGLCMLSGIALLIFAALGIPLPWFLQVIIDRGLDNRGLMILLLLGIIMTYCLREIFFYVSHFLFYYTGNRTLFGVRIKLFKHLQNLSLRFYQEYRTGKLISNILTDVASLNGMISAVLSNVVIHLFTIICIVIALFIMNPNFFVLPLIVILLQALNFTYFRVRMRAEEKELREMMSEVSANLAETINGIKVVKSFGKEHHESLGFAQRLRPTFDKSMNLNMLSAKSWICSEVINISGIVLLLWFGSLDVTSGEMTIGQLVAYYTYFTMLTGPVSSLSSMANVISAGMVSVERIGKLLDAVPEIKQAKNPRTLENPQGRLEFDEVEFGYEPTKRVLRKFTLDVESGKKVALVGPSGSGKSTIASLLMRFFDVSAGAIRIDGIDIRDLSTESLRNTVGIVLQESFLFSGTIEDNIRYSCENATHEQVVEAAKMANAHDFIMEQTGGYQAIVGENGAMLSGGQKQRIAIARAILKNPAVLILDEATSALDTVAEAAVQEALDTLMQNRTTVIIAHRLSTVRNADLIVVLKDGKIAQQGSHSQLLQQGGIYRDLYTLQLRDAKGARSDLFAMGEPDR